ncbi:hypothetical protein LB505_001689 [Fusarium chuoi]|nr:hypothetical protein LB505_001689 [Fusarium chuoi]
MVNVPNIKLNSGFDMPQIGFGLWKVDDNCADVVYEAIKAGYRLLDGACGLRVRSSSSSPSSGKPTTTRRTSSPSPASSSPTGRSTTLTYSSSTSPSPSSTSTPRSATPLAGTTTTPAPRSDGARPPTRRPGAPWRASLRRVLPSPLVSPTSRLSPSTISSSTPRSDLPPSRSSFTPTTSRPSLSASPRLRALL